MTTEAPLVSVVIPVKDGEQFMAEGIESVLAQEHEPLEVLVIDGASTDRSREIAASYDDVRLLDQRGTGLPGAWNEGIEAANGELIAFLDSDDRWLPQKLMRQVELFERNPRLGACVTRMRFFLEPGYSVPPGFREELFDGDNSGLMPSCLVARRRVFESEVGKFEESFGPASDVDWFARLKDSPVEVASVDEVLVEKRVHDRNLSLTTDEYPHQMLRSLRDTVLRKRAQGGS